MIKTLWVKGSSGRFTFADVKSYSMTNVSNLFSQNVKLIFALAPNLMLNIIGKIDDFTESKESMSSEEKIQSLQLHPLNYPLGARFYEKQEDSHCIPVTLEFVGIDGVLFGVKASTYDPRTTA